MVQLCKEGAARLSDSQLVMPTPVTSQGSLIKISPLGCSKLPGRHRARVVLGVDELQE